MADLKITDDKLEKILYSSMSPDVRETELKFQKKIGIRIIIMYILMAAAPDKTSGSRMLSYNRYIYIYGKLQIYECR